MKEEHNLGETYIGLMKDVVQKLSEIKEALEVESEAVATSTAATLEVKDATLAVKDEIATSTAALTEIKDAITVVSKMKS